MVAGWVAGGRAQRGYIKAAGVSSVVSNVLSVPNVTNNLTMEELTNSEVYHGIKRDRYTYDIWVTFHKLWVSCRRSKLWTLREVTIVRERLALKLNNVQLAKKLPDRTNVDVKDKRRNLAMADEKELAILSLF